MKLKSNLFCAFVSYVIVAIAAAVSNMPASAYVGVCYSFASRQEDSLDSLQQDSIYRLCFQSSLEAVIATREFRRMFKKKKLIFCTEFDEFCRKYASEMAYRGFKVEFKHLDSCSSSSNSLVYIGDYTTNKKTFARVRIQLSSLGYTLNIYMKRNEKKWTFLTKYLFRDDF